MRFFDVVNDRSVVQNDDSATFDHFTPCTTIIVQSIALDLSTTVIETPALKQLTLAAIAAPACIIVNHVLIFG